VSLEEERRDAADRRTNDLIGEFDAQVWARVWLEIIEEHPGVPTDEGAMIGWFANALMSGYDRGRADEQKRDLGEKVREIVYQAAGAATRPLLEDHPDYVFPSERVAEAVGYVCEQFGIPDYPKETRDGAGADPDGSGAGEGRV
jgi:hypothetical protein